MEEKLILYVGNKNISSWSMRPYVALTAKELRFEETSVDMLQDRDRRRRRAFSPTGKVPVLQHGKLRIPDSLAIIEYVEEAFPAPKYLPLWPKDRGERAHARWLSAAMHSGFMNLRESMSFHLCFLPNIPPATPEALDEAKEMMTMWDDALQTRKLSGAYLFGPFGAVDAMFAPAVVRLTSFRVPPVSNRVQGYMDAVLSHPAVRKWLEPARALPPAENY
ncbi:MAG TPA: glutathione S-transferase N-terminal domain-containing protein [Bdellovibrionota bacterium]|nr:glutathione S-transferase N-terminal domain-containing protein [Bdellovibrionota bacterium]